jgi:hypothetical protein
MTTPLERVNKVLEEVEGVKSLYGIDSWTEGFLKTIRQRAPETLTPKQEEVLSRIEARVFNEAEES